MIAIGSVTIEHNKLMRERVAKIRLNGLFKLFSLKRIMARVELSTTLRMNANIKPAPIMFKWTQSTFACSAL